MTVYVNGVDLYYEKSGEGRPLIMIHGNGEDHGIFDEAAAVLKDRFTCYLVDSRGHGQSTPVGELHYRDMADDMIAFMEALDLKDVVFYGFSDGGIVGLIAAAKCGRISDLIISGANLNPKGVKWFLRVVFRIMYAAKKDPKVRLMLQEPDIRDEELAAVSARTLVLAGSKDLVLEKQTKQIAAGIPGAELRILEGEDHGSYIVHNRRIGEIIRNYVKE